MKKYTHKELVDDLLGHSIAIFPGSKGSGKFGEVTSINDKGELKGTWGDFTVMPGVDKFELVSSNAVLRDKYIKIDL